MVSVLVYHFHGLWFGVWRLDLGFLFTFCAGLNALDCFPVSTFCITVLSFLLSPVLFWKAFPRVSSPAVHSLLFCLPLLVRPTLIGFAGILWVVKLNLCIEVAVPPSIITRCYPSPIFFFGLCLTFTFIYLFLLCLFGLCLPLLYQKAIACLNSL